MATTPSRGSGVDIPVDSSDRQAESVSVSDQRGALPNMSNADRVDAMMDGELEEEFRKLRGGEDESSTLQICAQVERSIKESGVLVMAEVANYMRCSSPNREAIEAVAKAAMEAALRVLQKLRAQCKYDAVLEKWTQAVVDSLECESRAEFVEKLAQLIQISECVRVIDEALDRQQQELSELRAMRSRFEAQEHELQELRSRMAAPAREAQDSPDWLHRMCAKDGIDIQEEQAQFVTPWTT